MTNKIFSILVLIFGIGLFTSCSSDDDNGNGNTSSIVGAWEFTKTGYSMDGTNEILVDYDNECPTMKDKIEFKSNGTFVSTYYDEDCVLEEYTESYTVDGNTIKVTDEGDTDEGEIMILNNTTLKIRFLETETGVYFITVLTRI